MALEKTWRWFGEGDTVTLAEIRQIGVEGIVTALHHIPAGEVWPVEEIEKVRDRIAAEGMRWSVVESLPVSEAIKLRTEECARHIDNYRQSLRNLAACGIHTVCYNFMPVLDWARTDLHYTNERGAESMHFDYDRFAAFDIHILGRPGASADYPPGVCERAAALAAEMSAAEQEELAHNIIVVTQGFINGTVGDSEDYKQVFLRYLARYDGIGPDRLREHLSAFLKEVCPVAQEAGINLCIHPDDPPFPLLGLPRIAGTIEDFRWILRQYDDPVNGVTFCAGSLSARPDNDLPAMARELGPRIHFVHLRNTQQLGPKSFFESGHLTGSVDMYVVLKALLEEQRRRIAEGRQDVAMPFRPDHGLRMLDDFGRSSNPGYTLVGRMKGFAEICGLEMGIERSL